MAAAYRKPRQKSAVEGEGRVEPRPAEASAVAAEKPKTPVVPPSNDLPSQDLPVTRDVKSEQLAAAKEPGYLEAQADRRDIVNAGSEAAPEQTGTQPPQVAAVETPAAQPPAAEQPPVQPVPGIGSPPSGAMVELGRQAATALVGPGGVATAPAVAPVALASAKPSFWSDLLNVSKTAGRNILELIGDFTAGYTHQAASPTEQRLKYEQELRLLGDQTQAQKDLAQMEAGFAAQRQKLDHEFQAKWNATTDARERENMRVAHEDRKRQLDIEQLQANNAYTMNQLNLAWQQKTFGAGHPELAHPGASYYGRMKGGG